MSLAPDGINSLTVTFERLHLETHSLADRKTPVRRVWKAVQRLKVESSRAQAVPSGSPSRPTSNSLAPDSSARSTKADQIIGPLKRPSGATLKSIMAVTGWQPHSVRGFISGKLRGMFPEELQWALVTSARQVKVPYGESLIFGRYHLYLREAQLSTTSGPSQMELAPSDPFLTGACAEGQLIGFQQPESWRVWSAEDPAKITLQREARGCFSMVLVGTALSKEPQALQVQMDNTVQTIQLRAEPTTIHLDYDLPTPVQTMVFRGITPTTPLQLGISGCGAFRFRNRQAGVHERGKPTGEVSQDTVASTGQT